MIRIHDIRLRSGDAAEVDVAWGERLERRDWFELRWVFDERLRATVVQPSVPSEFAAGFAQWLWAIAAAVERVRRGEVLSFPLDITSCRKPGTAEPNERDRARGELWSKIRRLQGCLLNGVSDDERSRMISEIQQLSAELRALDDGTGA
jgi:hypothetical protein